MTKMNTTYCLPPYWKNTWYRPIRAWNITRWRNKGFLSFADKRKKQLASYKAVKDRYDQNLRQGIAYAYIRRVRESGDIVLTKPQLTDRAVRNVIGAN